MCLKNVLIKNFKNSDRKLIGYKVCEFTQDEEGISFLPIYGLKDIRYHVGEEISLTPDNIVNFCGSDICEGYPHGIHCYLSLADAFYCYYQPRGYSVLSNSYVIALEFFENDILAFDETPVNLTNWVPSLPCIVISRAKVLESIYLDYKNLPYRAVKMWKRNHPEYPGSSNFTLRDMHSGNPNLEIAEFVDNNKKYIMTSKIKKGI